MSIFRRLTENERISGWLVSHTAMDGALEIPLTGDKRDPLLRHWATGRGHFEVDEYAADGHLVPLAGDAWEPVDVPAVAWKDWIQPHKPAGPA